MKNGEVKHIDLSGQNVLSMRDAQSAVAAGATQVRVCEKCVITPSARDFLRQHDIELVTGAVAAAPAPAPKPAARLQRLHRPSAAEAQRRASSTLPAAAAARRVRRQCAARPIRDCLPRPRPKPSSWRFARLARSCGTASMSTATAAISRTASGRTKCFARRPWSASST